MRIAHLSDVHLVASVPRAGYRLRTSAIRFGRSRDEAVRASKLARAIGEARARGGQQLVLSGDLTEVGDDAELALLAEVLEAARLTRDDVVLVPGNHDAYSSRDAWDRALRTVLAPWADASAPQGGVREVDRGDVVFVAVDTSRPQAMAFSGGELDAAQAESLDRALTRAGSRAAVIVTHHPPFLRKDTTAHRVLDALRGSERLLAVLARHPRASLLHGHFHRRAARSVPTDRDGSAARIFGAAAVADDASSPDVATYDAIDGALVPTRSDP